MDLHVPCPQNDLFIRELTNCQAVLCGYCRAALGGPSEDAKDAWQRTNVTLWRKAAEWRPETDFLPWALAVARFEVLATVRDRQRERLAFDSDVIELMADESVQAAVEGESRREALDHCTGNLPDRQRRILFGHYVAGFPLAEIASANGMKEGAVKVLLLRVRRSLANCIENYMRREARP